MDKICFERSVFNIYILIILCIIIYFFYYKISSYYNSKYSLDSIKLKEKNCQFELNLLKSISSNSKSTPNTQQDVFLSKIYNPLTSPEIIYPGGTLNSSGYDAYKNYQMIGYLTGLQGQFPVFGRYKYPGRSDKMEYYTINDSRGRVKIPFKTNNFNELFDGDSIIIDELGGSYTFKKYENEQFRYDPNVY